MLGRTTFCPTSKKPGILAAVSNLPRRSRKICFFVSNFSDWLLPPPIIIWLWETLTAALLMGDDTHAETHETAQTKTAVRKIIFIKCLGCMRWSAACVWKIAVVAAVWSLQQASTNTNLWRTLRQNIKTKKIDRIPLLKFVWLPEVAVLRAIKKSTPSFHGFSQIILMVTHFPWKETVFYFFLLMLYARVRASA